MKMITLYLPEPWIGMLDELVGRDLFPNRAEAIRSVVRDLISDYGMILEHMEKKRKTKEP